MSALVFEEGLLPSGDFDMTLEELAESLLVKGERGLSQWDSTWRAELVTNLGVLANQLWTVGIDDIFVDGSFVEDKAHPNDIDGYFVCERSFLASGRLQHELNEDEFGNELEFPAAFRVSRDRRRPKGIVKLRRSR